jgi:hypothetical protein
VIKPEGKRPLGRPGLKWMDNIKLDLGATGWCVEGWICLAQVQDICRALVSAVMNLWIPHNGGDFLSGCITGGLLNSAQFHRVSEVVYNCTFVKLYFTVVTK